MEEFWAWEIPISEKFEISFKHIHPSLLGLQGGNSKGSSILIDLSSQFQFYAYVLREISC